MRLGWFGILALSFFWLKALPVFAPQRGASSWVLAGAAILIVALRNHPFWLGGPRKASAMCLLGVSILSVIYLHGPFQTGFVILGAASLLSLIPFPSPLRQWALPGLWCSGAVLAVQAACVPFLYIFSSRYHRTAELPFLHDFLSGYPAFPWLASLLYLPLKVLNWATALSGQTIYLPTTLDTLPLTPTWEKLGLFPIALFSAGACLFLLLLPARRRRLRGLILCLAGYAYIRLLLLFLLVNHIRDASLFWRFDYQFCSFLPLPLLLGTWWKAGVSGLQESPSGGSGSPRQPLESVLQRLRGGQDWGRNEKSSARDAPVRFGRVLLGTLLLSGGLTALFGFHDPGIPKEGRILIDERHSNWEWTTQPFDTTWYGGKSGYNYYCLADYWNHFYHVETRTDSLTPELLSHWDILVIKTPTSSFSADEVDAIEEFIREGGGLFLIGDHTNVFGTSTYLNPIAERFGMYFRYDATYNLANLGLSLFERPHHFPHPVVRFMPDYLFATSCSLYSPLLSENIILGYGLRAMYLDYSETSYFPVKEGKMDYDFGLFVQAGGVRYGKGRVLGYTDSTCFSNFFMFMPGKPELALGSIEWLNRKNHSLWLWRIFLLLSLIGLSLLVVEGVRYSGVSYWNVVITAGTLAVISLGWIGERSVTRSYATPRPQRPIVHVTFDQKHGNYVLPTTSMAITNWQNFQTFFVWTQRLGLVPRNEYSVEKAVENSSALVEIHPFRPFTIEELDLIVNFVQRGGNLIVLDSPDNIYSTSRMLLGPFSIAFDGEQADSVAVLDDQGDTLGVARKAYGLSGAIPLSTLADGRTAMGYINFGKGKVIASGVSYLFSSEYMGNTAVVPDDARRRIFRAEYDLFEKISGLRVQGRYYVDDDSSEAKE